MEPPRPPTPATDTREAVAHVLLAAWGGFMLATSVMAVTIKPDHRWWWFLIAGLIYVGYPLWCALRAQLQENPHD